MFSSFCSILLVAEAWPGFDSGAHSHSLKKKTKVEPRLCLYSVTGLSVFSPSSSLSSSSGALPPVVPGSWGANWCCCQGKTTSASKPVIKVLLYTHMHTETSPPGVKYCFQAAYDKICAAKKQAEERTRKLDDKRKKIKLGESLCSSQSFSRLTIYFWLKIIGIRIWLCLFNFFCHSSFQYYHKFL